MFNENDLRELLEFSAPDQVSVLSVYLNTNPSEGNADAYKLRLRNILKEISLVQDVEAVERYFDHEYNWAGRSVAVFSCAAAGFFRAYPLAIPVRDMAYTADRASVKPLADLLDNYGGYGVVLVDKQGARLFYFHIGELREQEGTLGEAVKRTKRGGSSSFPGRRGGVAGRTRAADELVERNMKEACDFAGRFFEENHVRRILIGGTDDNVALFRSLLPKSWQSLVVGDFPISMTASHTEVQARAMQVGRESERRREDLLVQRLATTAAKGGEAVLGLEKTLEAINEGRVQTLVVAKDFHQEGYRCLECNLLSTLPEQVCAACNNRYEKIGDIVEHAVNAAMRHGGEVEVVHSGSPLEEAGEIGAILRY